MPHSQEVMFTLMKM